VNSTRDQADYDLLYGDRRRVCGEPSPRVRAFFAAFAGTRAEVLDLGCGQGRDALMAARLGHRVVGVDLSAVGVAQMRAEAEVEDLRVRGCVADIRTFRVRRRFDIVLLDRVLHLLPADADRLAMLKRLSSLTRSGSFVLIADVRSNTALIRGFFDRHRGAWRIARRVEDFICVERTIGKRRMRSEAP
jgi:tellurite methyltransferase